MERPCYLSGCGSQSYAETNYATPHAATSVGGTTYSYDNNGNVTSIGSLDYTWDWRNRLSSAERSGEGSTTYGYDHTGQRVFQATGSATTSYPNPRYYQGSRGQFMSQDPVFVNLGVDRRTAQVLRDPQQLNSYSYARGNPITLKDPTGEALPLLAGFLAIPTGSAILHWIGLGSMAIGLVKTAESFHSNIILPRQYKNAYTPEQKSEAPFRFAAEATLNVGTNTIEPVGAQLASDIFLTGLEYVPADLLEERRKDRFETN